MPTHQSLKSSFRRSVRLGTGRAYLLAQANPSVDFSTYIIEACCRNFAYDGQAESNRSAYLYGLYRLSAQHARIRRAVLKALATEQADTWTLTQLFALVLRFAQDGDAVARAALYHRFLNKTVHLADWIGAEEIMELDGLDGLKWVARKFGQYLARNPDDRQDDYLFRPFQETHPEVDVWAELRLLAMHDADVRRYILKVEDTLARQAAHQAQRPAKVPDSDLQGIMREKGVWFRLKRRGLAPHEIQQLSEQLLTEKNRATQENILIAFSLFPFPLPYQPILAWARQKPNGRNRQRTQAALEALSLLSAPEIREFALQRLQHTSQPAPYAEILTSNYQEGDAALLTAIAARTHEEHAIEQLAISYTAIYAANKTPECAAPLLALYAKMTCGIHRNTVVKLLIENNVLPAWLNEELPFDSYAETRLLYQPQLK